MDSEGPIVLFTLNFYGNQAPFYFPSTAIKVICEVTLIHHSQCQTPAARNLTDNLLIYISLDNSRLNGINSLDWNFTAPTQIFIDHKVREANLQKPKEN